MYNKYFQIKFSKKIRSLANAVFGGWVGVAEWYFFVIFFFVIQKKISLPSLLKTKKMTQILLQNGIDNMQMNVLMGLFNSWNVDVVVTEEKKQENRSFSQLFSKTRGMWQDYDIDGEKLRKEAWGINEKTTV